MDRDLPVRLKCKCRHTASIPENIFLDQAEYTCAACGRIFNLDDDDDEDLEIEYPYRPIPEIFWYLAPMVVCPCGVDIELPYSGLPQTDQDGVILLKGEDPPELPSEDWTATFGCRGCGRVSAYFEPDVTIRPLHKSAEGTYQSGKGVYSVQFPCGDRRCTTPASMFVDIGTGNASAVVDLLRSGLFDGVRLGCGHEMKTVPKPLYKVESVMRRMW